MYGAVFKAIERYEYSLKWEQEIPHKLITKEYMLEDQTLESLQEVLNNKEALQVELSHEEIPLCCGGSHTASSINLTFNLTEDQKQSELQKCLLYRSNAVKFITGSLVRKPDQKDSLKRALKSKGLEIPELEKLLK
ncbi:hypothetical protein VPH184E373B_0135 [Vibrio phage 184E37-3b]|nr:hypothetical protein MYOV056v2_p0117 [Vibrio phage 184E37.3a]QZI89937.1 hypothetical protein MYOV057v1_p0022 [Vibrio phage 184E37.1]